MIKRIDAKLHAGRNGVADGPSTSMLSRYAWERATVATVLIAGHSLMPAYPVSLFFGSVLSFALLLRFFSSLSR